MTRTDPVERLRLRDPAAGLASPDLEPILREIVRNEPAQHAPRRVGRVRRPAVALGALAGLTAAVLLLPGAPTRTPSLAERAYAATAPENGILFSVRRISFTQEGPAASTRPAPDTRFERWQRGDDLHIRISTPEGPLEQVLADGKLTFRYPDGSIKRSGEGEQGEVLTDFIPLIRTDPVADFRTEFADDGLTDAGPSSFAGREARRFTLPEQREDIGEEQLTVTREFFLDPSSGAPLGSRYTSRSSEQQTGALRALTTTTTEIDRVERLPPTPENLQLLQLPAG